VIPKKVRKAMGIRPGQKLQVFSSGGSTRLAPLRRMETPLGARQAAGAAQLQAGAAQVDTTDREAGPVNDPLYVKALVLKDGATTVELASPDLSQQACCSSGSAPHYAGVGCG
jgi:bifunctional DNA-binding transcriptional regulator/antitoxin component of YhaV-PrlF toxin-antitoxin module